jgi:hypothetical protein
LNPQGQELQQGVPQVLERALEQARAQVVLLEQVQERVMVQAQAQAQVVGLVLAQAQAVVAALAEARVLSQGLAVLSQVEAPVGEQVLARVEEQVEVLEPGWEQGPLVEL